MPWGASMRVRRGKSRGRASPASRPWMRLELEGGLPPHARRGTLVQQPAPVRRLLVAEREPEAGADAGRDAVVHADPRVAPVGVAVGGLRHLEVDAPAAGAVVELEGAV